MAGCRPERGDAILLTAGPEARVAAIPLQSSLLEGSSRTDAKSPLQLLLKPFSHDPIARNIFILVVNH